jgi:uncharacterized protein (TIGR04255 family)
VTAVVVDPFTPVAPEEVPLDNAPLALVLCQVRFPLNLSFGLDSTLAEVQARLKGRYPILDREQTVGFTIQSEGGVVAQPKAETLLRFRSKERDWQVSLATEFVALDTRAYVSRTDFMERLGEVLDVLAEVDAPAECSRIGMRYVNRLTEQKFLDHLRDWVRPEVLGPNSFIPSDHVDLFLSVCESQFRLDDTCGAQTRWGVVPPNVNMDPSYPAVPGPSWVLDFDMFTAARQDFESKSIVKEAERFAEYAYAFFRWVCKPSLLRELGGDVDDDDD